MVCPNHRSSPGALSHHSRFRDIERPYFSDEFEYEPDAVKKNLKDERLKHLLPGLAERLAPVEDFTHEATESTLRAYAEEQALRPAS